MRTKPTFSPFEVTTSADGKTIISTWRHQNGETEQWAGDEFVYGPELVQKDIPQPTLEEPKPDTPDLAENPHLSVEYRKKLEEVVGKDEADPEKAAIEHTPKASQPEEPKHEDKKGKGK